MPRTGASWEQGNPALSEAPRHKTDDDIVIKRLYTPDDLAEFDYERDLGYPGEAPFTRHVYKAGCLGR